MTNPTKIKFPAGARVHCPQCHKVVATVVNDVWEGSRQMSSDFEWSDEDIYYKHGGIPQALCCGVGIMKDGTLIISGPEDGE